MAQGHHKVPSLYHAHTRPSSDIDANPYQKQHQASRNAPHKTPPRARLTSKSRSPSPPHHCARKIHTPLSRAPCFSRRAPAPLRHKAHKLPPHPANKHKRIHPAPRHSFSRNSKTSDTQNFLQI